MTRPVRLLLPLAVPIDSSAGRSTMIVLLDGQYVTGGCTRASEQSCESNVSFGGSFGGNRIAIESTTDCTDRSVTGNSPSSPSGSRTGRSPRRPLISVMLIAAQDDGPSVKPN